MARGKSSKKVFDPASLSERERERYGRNMIIREWGGEKGQQRLKRSTVLVAGAGGSGSPLLLYLAAAGVGRIKICDGDRVSVGNLNRQVLYCEGSVGKNKAGEAKKALGRLNSDISVESYPFHIAAENAFDLIKGCDAVCCAVDDKAAMKLIGRVSAEAKIPVVWAGGFYMGGFLTFIDPPATPCLECILDILDRLEQDVKAGRIEMRKDITLAVEGANPIVGAAAGAAGAMQAMEVIKYIVGIGENCRGTMLEFQMGGANMQFNNYDVNHLRREGCPICRAQ